MSLATVIQRVDALHALVYGPAAVTPVAPPAATATAAATGSGSTGFADLLAQQVAADPAAGVSAGTPYAAEITAAAVRNGVDPALVRAVVEQESGFDPDAKSTAGAQGLMQLMPATARSLGVVDPYDPVQSIEGGTRYLRSMLDRFDGDVSLALAAYNAGPNAVARYGGIPPYRETQSYVEHVLDDYQATRQERSVP